MSHAELREEIKQLKLQFDCLAKLVILHEPEIWEYYLEDIKLRGLDASPPLPGDSAVVIQGRVIQGGGCIGRLPP